MPTQAEEYFAEWSADPATAFAFITSQVGNASTDLFEREWLDYKAASMLWYRDGAAYSLDNRKAEVRRILSEMISAFANVSGGLLIWGINAPRKVPTGKSFAQDVHELKEIVSSSILDATDPPVNGVIPLALPDPSDSPKGIVVVFVPRSKRPPHRANYGERTFFQRTQDNSVPIVTSMLQSMFYPRARPNCRINAFARLAKSVSSPEHASPRIIFSVSNTGEASAHDMYVQLAGKLGGSAVEFSSSEPLWQKYELGKYLNCGCTLSLHPGHEFPVGNLSARAPVVWSDLIDRGLALEVTIFARDMEPIKWRASLSSDIILTAVTNLVQSSQRYCEVNLPVAIISAER